MPNGRKPSNRVHLDPSDPRITSVKESSLTAGPCPVCGTVMATRHGMRRHFKVMHKQSEASECKICNRKFLTTFAIQRHMKRVHPEETIESLSFRTLDSDSLTSCPYCSKSFSSKQSLDRHLRIVHQHVEIGICPICDKTFSNKFAMKRHQENVHAASHHICSKCELGFSSKFALMGHNLALHHTSKIFACSHCSLCFLDAGERNRHVSEKHNPPTGGADKTEGQI
ncbi:hypothetical protein Aperf_G00000095816 [Anoplocephala perfoliata]